MKTNLANMAAMATGCFLVAVAAATTAQADPLPGEVLKFSQRPMIAAQTRGSRP